jgi:hypothetical protein
MKLLAIVFLLLACSPKPSLSPGQRIVEQTHTGFMPPNLLHLADDLQETYQISESDFDLKIAAAEAFFGPIVAAHGARFVVVKRWEDATVNAYATRDGDKWEVDMFGGLARRPEITPDGFALVICHEVGHHLGGFPFYPQQSWPAAVEGQSDYYSSLVCGRAMWKGEPEKNAEAAKVIPPYPKAKCDAAWSEQADKDLCYRIMLAGKSLADLLSYGKAKYDQPDKGQVPRTNPNHPQGQCRLDTYMAGALCGKAFDLSVIPQSEKEAAKQECLKSKGEVGARPACWFKASL